MLIDHIFIWKYCGLRMNLKQKAWMKLEFGKDQSLQTQAILGLGFV